MKQSRDYSRDNCVKAGMYLMFCLLSTLPPKQVTAPLISSVVMKINLENLETKFLRSLIYQFVH